MCVVELVPDGHTDTAPAKHHYGAFVYRSGPKTFTLERAVRFRYALLLKKVRFVRVSYIYIKGDFI